MTNRSLASAYRQQFRDTQTALRNYVNEQADTGGDFPEQAYGSSKYQRMRDVKARYDPTNLFRLNANIAPTVP